MSNNIVFLVAGFPPIVGGISHYLHQIVSHLPSEQVRVLGLPSEGWQSFDCQQVYKIERLNLNPSWHPSSSQFKLLAPFYYTHLRKLEQFDLILCGQAHHTLMLPAWLMQEVRGIPFGVFTYCLDLLAPQKKKYRPVFNALLRSAQIVFADSRAAGTISGGLGVHSRKIQVVNPSIDVAKLESDVPPDIVRKRHNLADKRCILSVGHLVERKGFDTVIRALPQILQSVPEAHYLIVGDGPVKKYLESLIGELRLENHVTFAGYVRQSELAAYYQVSDVFAMISREIPAKGDIEGFGIVYLEAAFMRKPVVAGRSGGVSDAVVHGRTGFLVDPQNVNEVAQAVVRLLRDPKLALRMGEYGRNRVLRDFSGEKGALRVLNGLLEMGLN